MPVQTVSPGFVAGLLEQHAALTLLDVRSPPEFERLHARGAVSCPSDRLDSFETPADASGVPLPVYLICQSGRRSLAAVEKLSGGGAAQVFSVEGGTAAWQAAGLPVLLGKSNVISLERQVRIGAGALVVLGTVLALTLHRSFLAVPLFVGSGLVFAGVTDYCGMGLLLSKLPWNR